MHYAIIGAGFSGLYAAYLLEQSGHRVTVYEKKQQVGGHCASLTQQDAHVELGTVVSFSKNIKKLMIALQVPYQERFVYRNFVDKDFSLVAHLDPSTIIQLQSELQRLKAVLTSYGLYPSPLTYGTIPPELRVSCRDFLKNHAFTVLDQVIEPYLSSFGFGSIKNVAAYYVFHAFDLHIVEALLQGERFLFASYGMQSLTQALANQLHDIRCDRDITSVETIDNKVTITTNLDCCHFDHVFLTCPLKPSILQHSQHQKWMQLIHTHPYVSCAFAVENKDLITTYFKHHFGKQEKIQFFTVSNQKEQTLLVSHSYGLRSKAMVDDIILDLAKSDIHIAHLMTTRQWHIFPHIPLQTLESTSYDEIANLHLHSPIQWIGSLITNPSIDRLYESIKSSLKDHLA
ncbi:MAG: FAD-dependent oxidoreductase [Erysipelotrichaceae bacterium]